MDALAKLLEDDLIEEEDAAPRSAPASLKKAKISPCKATKAGTKGREGGADAGEHSILLSGKKRRAEDTALEVEAELAFLEVDPLQQAQEQLKGRRQNGFLARKRKVSQGSPTKWG